MIEFRLDGITPSKKNNRRLFSVNGRQTSAPSKEHDAWFQIQKPIVELAASGYPIPLDIEPVYIAYVFVMPDKVQRDLSNMQQSIEDLISTKGKGHKQGVGIVHDDCWRYLQTAGAVAKYVKGEAYVLVAIEDELKPLRIWVDMHMQAS
jgi:hypothetical protein